jgi:hypothetical protein
MPELFEILAKGAMRLAAPATQTITDADFTVLEFDTVTDERGGFVCDPATNSITVPSTGLYTVNQGIDAIFPGSEMIEVMSFANDVEYSPEYLMLQGRANQKPVSLFWQSTVSLTAGDVINLRCKNGEAGSFDINLIRMYFAIIKEH